ncbi:hypothetical protein B0F90DRAFT_1756924 [Multifurca ochricompacta]|uniref:Uncharacterized protein n=1 Tax=Multifurca ochricompacta TaxID=376703 RepID=A0AAD4LZG3_9AGAM|nr:hypothetical protein B0F90DRAFT_1756924 [Multifurca ochricompacta]
MSRPLLKLLLILLFSLLFFFRVQRMHIYYIYICTLLCFAFFFYCPFCSPFLFHPPHPTSGRQYCREYHHPTLDCLFVLAS